MNQKCRTGIVIFPDVEVLDFCGPFEVFSAVRLNEERRREEASPFEVILIAEQPGPICATGGLKVLPDHALETCPSLDLLLIPGGWGTRREIRNEQLLGWIAARSREVETLASVCTGAMLLGQAGLLDGKRATTHWKSLGWMRESFPNVTVVDDLHVVEDGNVITSAGISAGIDLALRIVANHHGEPIARATARHMEYPFPEQLGRRISF